MASTTSDSSWQPSLGARSGWYWMVGFLLVAVSTAIPIRWVKRLEQLRLETAMQTQTDIRKDGGDAVVSSDSGVHQIKLPPQRTEFWLERLKDYPYLYHVSFAGLKIGDAEVEQLIQDFPMLGSVDLSDTLITDRALEALARSERLMRVNLSRTKVSAEAIGKFLSVIQSRVRSLILEDMQLTDKDFEKIYDTYIHEWGLAGNRLSEKSLLPIFENGVYRLDFSRNPGSESIFLNPQIRASPETIILDELSIGDAEVAAWLATAPPSHIVLGRTSITLAGLSSLLSVCSSMSFLEGSFDEQSLSQLRPLTIPNTIGFSGKSFTGDFLIHWGGLPQWLDAANSSFSDTQLAELTNKRTALMPNLCLRNCPITDASVPLLERLQVRHLELSNTQVTAAALLRSSIRNATITVTPDQFTYRELEILRERNKIIVVSGFESW